MANCRMHSDLGYTTTADWYLQAPGDHDEPLWGEAVPLCNVHLKAVVEYLNPGMPRTFEPATYRHIAKYYGDTE